MRPQSAPVVLLQFSVFLIAAASSLRKSQSQQSPPDYDQYDSKNQPPYKSYDYSRGSDYNTYEMNEVPEYQCYQCTYQVRRGSAAGQDNCRDPFVKSGILLIPCKGPCAKIYHKTSETEYTISRTCLLGCNDLKDEKGYTQCCFGNFCNGSPSSRLMSNILLLFLGITLVNLLS